MTNLDSITRGHAAGIRVCPGPKVQASLPQGWDLLWISLECGWQGNVRALENEVLFSLG